VIDELAKASLHDNLRWIREDMLAKLDGLSEYDVRRPLTTTGTNLLGLVKHLSLAEARYFGDVMDRPTPWPLPRWDDDAARSLDGRVGAGEGTRLHGNDEAYWAEHRARIQQAAATFRSR